MEESLSFIPLLIVIFLAFLVPLILSRFKRFQIPIVIGEIIAGILIGPSLLNFVKGDETILVLLSEFGFVFLMFLSGTEIDFTNLSSKTIETEKINKVGKNPKPLQLSLIMFLLTLVLAIGFGFLFVHFGYTTSPWMLALILSTTSLGIVVPVLKERNMTTGRYGQTLLLAALIADFVTMFLITILVAQLSHGFTFDILLIGLLFVTFFLVYRLGSFFFNRSKLLRDAMSEVSHATGQIKVRLALTIMLTFVVLAEVLGAEVILGAFLAGAVIALLRTPDDKETVNQLEAIGYGFFIPIFFIFVGVNFDLPALLSSPETLTIAMLLLSAAIIVKIIPSLVFHFLFSWRETLAAGTLLSARLSLIIAASAIGLRLGLINNVTNAMIILIAIITVTLAPLIFNRIILSQISEISQPIIVAGANQLGLHVAERLKSHHENVIIIDNDQDRIDRAKKMGFNACVGFSDHMESEFLKCMDNAHALVCTHNNTERNYAVCEQAHTVFGIDHIVAHLTDPKAVNRFEQIGVITLTAILDRGKLLELLVRNPSLYELLTHTEDNKEITEISFENPFFNHKKIRELGLPGDVLILALHRNGEIIVPHGNTRLEIGDRLTIAGSLVNIEAARRQFSIALKAID
jgi:Kef-type K+ transport system membrane component KefB/Trk K+ transport system NAD-binding subunit